MLLKVIATIGLILLTELVKGYNDGNWIVGFSKSIQNDQQIHQVIFFIDDNIVATNTVHDKLLQKLSRNISVRKIGIPKSRKPTSSDFISLNPQISLFILTSSEDDPQFSRSFDFLIELSEAKRRPKCLLLVYQKITNYRQFFETLWEQQFLDITVIEMRKFINPTNLNNTKEGYPKKANNVLQYNPFLKKMTKQRVTAKTVWFPEKLKNMHGYQIKVSLLPVPPDVLPKQNLSHKYVGLSISKIECLQEVMNFTLVESTLSKFGRLTCKVEGSTGVIRGLFTNEIQMMGLERFRALCNGRGIEFSKGLQTIEFALIVPFMRKDTQSRKFEKQIINILLVMILPLVLWILSRVMGFEKGNWKIDYLVRIVLGTSTPKEPTTTIQRIIFGTFLIGCFMFSSDIFSSITEAQLETASTFKYETLTDVLKSDLLIMISANNLAAMEKTVDGVEQQILMKANTAYGDESKCLNYLLNYKNTSCIVEIVIAEFILQNLSKSMPQAAKIIKGSFLSGPSATFLGAGSPYARRMDQVIQRIIESGLSSKWKEAYTERKNNLNEVTSCVSSHKKENSDRQLIILILVTGLFCSFLIFLFELIVYNLRN